MSDILHYSMLIRWSEEDRVYLVTLPEWKGHLGNWEAATHGATYDEAARMGREVLEMLIACAREDGMTPPAPQVFASSSP
jgi:predicted RNase H-like HicB family nuclease